MLPATFSCEAHPLAAFVSEALRAMNGKPPFNVRQNNVLLVIAD